MPELAFIVKDFLPWIQLTDMILYCPMLSFLICITMWSGWKISCVEGGRRLCCSFRNNFESGQGWSVEKRRRDKRDSGIILPIHFMRKQAASRERNAASICAARKNPKGLDLLVHNRSKSGYVLYSINKSTALGGENRFGKIKNGKCFFLGICYIHSSFWRRYSERMVPRWVWNFTRSLLRPFATAKVCYWKLVPLFYMI